MSALQVEIAKVEQEINVLAQIKAWIASEKTAADVVTEMNLLSSVHQRLVAALPPARAPRKPRDVKPVNAAKPDGKAKQATA